MLKIIGAGLGRTGTSSLKWALEQLGFGQCYHMNEFFQNPQHVIHWKNAQADRGVDWDELFAGYQSAVDYPSALFYKQQMQVYPHAKVILTVRDAGKWYESVVSTIYPVSSNRRRRAIASILRWVLPEMRRMYPVITFVPQLIWQEQFDNRFEDKAYAMSIFEQWNESVKQTVPAEKLLVYEVQQGWEPLCDFLGVPVPQTAFPRANSREAFQENFKRRNPLARILGR